MQAKPLIRSLGKFWGGRLGSDYIRLKCWISFNVDSEGNHGRLRKSGQHFWNVYLIAVQRLI